MRRQASGHVLCGVANDDTWITWPRKPDCFWGSPGYEAVMTCVSWPGLLQACTCTRPRLAIGSASLCRRKHRLLRDKVALHNTRATITTQGDGRSGQGLEGEKNWTSLESSGWSATLSLESDPEAKFEVRVVFGATRLPTS